MNKFFLFFALFLIFSVQYPAAFSKTVTDDIVELTLKDKEFIKPAPYLEYNFADTDIVLIKVSPISDIENENDVYEGQNFKFIVREDVKYKKQILIKKNTPVNARVETVVSSGMNGIPAYIIFGNFEIPGINNTRLQNTLTAYGQDRSLWVFPLKWALTPLPPTGSLTNFIKGGHVSLKKDDILKLYYHPNWI